MLKKRIKKEMQTKNKIQLQGGLPDYNFNVLLSPWSAVPWPLVRQHLCNVQPSLCPRPPRHHLLLPLQGLLLSPPLAPLPFLTCAFLSVVLGPPLSPLNALPSESVLAQRQLAQGYICVSQTSAIRPATCESPQGTY